MEKKYIEVNELLKSFTPDYSVYSSNKPIRIDLRLIKRIITRQPIVDVAEVKHGEWATDEEDIKWGNALKRKHCSVCQKRPLFDKEKREFVLTKFCPNCGADMRGELK